jgi:hypothetical protein
MTAADPTEEQTARRPMSYVDAADTGPCVDPALVLAVGRIGGNLNQIARWLNRAMQVGCTHRGPPPADHRATACPDRRGLCRC